MHLAATSRRHAALIAAAVALLLAAVAALLMGSRPDAARAGLNLNNNICKGSITKGDAEAGADDPTAVPVRYRLACAQPITGYSIFLDGHPATSIETEVFGTDTAGGVVPTDAFSCNGELPGYGLNCVGTYGGNWTILTGQFTIDTPLCQEPRVNPVVSVATATVDAKGKPVQALAGPFDLGRPRKAGCKPTNASGKTKIPDTSKDAPVIQ